MKKICINGGKPLYGETVVQGSKNSVLPILAASFLTEEACVIENCPDLSDVHVALEILEGLGCSAEYSDNKVYLYPTVSPNYTISDDLMRRMRSSVMFLGAILGRCKKARISYPGGCELGARPIDIHLRALRELGVKVVEDGGYIDCQVEKFTPKTLTLMFPSVGATENIILMSAVSQGETVIINPAREPEVVDLQNFLNTMGANICGAGSDYIRIKGVKKLQGCRYSVIPDRVVAATYACGVTACGGKILLKNVEPCHMQMLLAQLLDMGADVKCEDSTILVEMNKRPLPVPMIKTLPYPGFPTDMQAPLMAALLRAKGSSVVSETIFENRFKHVGEFLRMGADIRVEGMNAYIRGVSHIHGADVEAADLRGGAALTVAGLSARGRTTVSKIHYIDRGYEDIVRDFKNLGGDIDII